MWGMDSFEGGWGGDAWGFEGGFDGFGKGGFGKGKDKGGGKGKKGSKAAMKLAKGEKVYSGKLYRYMAEKTAGYVYSDGVLNEFGQDSIYAFQNVLDEAKCGVGDEICFFLHWNARGQIQVSSPVMRLSSAQENNLVLKGIFKKAKDESKPYGFISSPQCQEYFGRDVYVAAGLTEGLVSGGLVAFNAYLNKDGMPNASAVCVCEESYEPAPGDLSVDGEMPGFEKGGKGKGKGKGFGKGKDGKGKGKGKSKEFDKMAAMAAMGLGGKGGFGPY